jgi:hypothetical protein
MTMLTRLMAAERQQDLIRAARRHDDRAPARATRWATRPAEPHPCRARPFGRRRVRDPAAG